MDRSCLFRPALAIDRHDFAVDSSSMNLFLQWWRSHCIRCQHAIGFGPLLKGHWTMLTKEKAKRATLFYLFTRVIGALSILRPHPSRAPEHLSATATLQGSVKRITWTPSSRYSRRRRPLCLQMFSHVCAWVQAGHEGKRKKSNWNSEYVQVVVRNGPNAFFSFFVYGNFLFDRTVL